MIASKQNKILVYLRDIFQLDEQQFIDTQHSQNTNPKTRIYIYIYKLTTIGLDNSLSPGRHQAIIRTNDGILSIGHPGTNFNEISIKIHTFSFTKIHLKMSYGKWRPFCLGLNVLRWIEPNSFSTAASISAQPRWPY